MLETPSGQRRLRPKRSILQTAKKMITCYLDVKMAEKSKARLVFNHTQQVKTWADKTVELLSLRMNEAWFIKDHNSYLSEPLKEGMLINYYRTDGWIRNPFGLEMQNPVKIGLMAWT